MSALTSQPKYVFVLLTISEKKFFPLHVKNVDDIKTTGKEKLSEDLVSSMVLLVLTVLKSIPSMGLTSSNFPLY